MINRNWTTSWQLTDLYVEDRGDGSARLRRGDWSEWLTLDPSDVPWVIARLQEVAAPTPSGQV